MALLNPQEISIKTKDGVEKTYILSDFPAIQGREIIVKYPLSGMPKLGDYMVNEETMLKLMAFVAVPIEGSEPLRLTSRALVDNHVPDWETLARIEVGMLEKNCSFFRNAKSLGFLANIQAKLPALITKILTDYSAQLSAKEKPVSTN